MKQDIQNILVIGANGSTGQLICNQLSASPGYQPVAMIREESQKENFNQIGIRTVVGDLEGDFEHAFENIDAVIFAAGSGSETGKDKTKAVDEKGAKQSVDYAKKYHLKKFVMLSAMGTENPDPDSDISHYLKAKHEADEYLKASGLNFTIVRPGSLTNEEGSGKIEAAKHLDKKGKISRENVALTLVKVLPTDILPERYFEVLDGNKPISEAISALKHTIYT